MGKITRHRIVLGLEAHDFVGLAVGAPNILNRLAQSPNIFTAPNPPLPVLEKLVKDYLDAHTAVITTHAKGTTEAREVRRNLLWTGLESERAYVQAVCDSAPEHAAEYATLAGMRLFERTQPSREVLVVELTTVPGQAVLRAAASLLEAPGKSRHMARTYFWRYQVNGGPGYVSVEPTPVSFTVVNGFPPASTLAFQVAVKDAKGMSEWSQAVTIQIH